MICIKCRQLCGPSQNKDYVTDWPTECPTDQSEYRSRVLFNASLQMVGGKHLMPAIQRLKPNRIFYNKPHVACSSEHYCYSVTVHFSHTFSI